MALPDGVSDKIIAIAMRRRNITQKEVSEIVRDTASNRLPQLVQEIRALAETSLLGLDGGPDPLKRLEPKL